VTPSTGMRAALLLLLLLLVPLCQRDCGVGRVDLLVAMGYAAEEVAVAAAAAAVDGDRVVNAAALDDERTGLLLLLLVHRWSERDEARQNIERVAMIS
jgi:hypothetical protein